MQNRTERQPQDLYFFGRLEEAVEGLVDEIDEQKLSAGQKIMELTRTTVSHIEKGILPDFIDVAEETPHDHQQDPTKRLIVQYDTRQNRLLLTRNYEGRPYGVEVLKTIEDKDWPRYGIFLVRALRTAAYTPQQVKKQ